MGNLFPFCNKYNISFSLKKKTLFYNKDVTTKSEANCDLVPTPESGVCQHKLKF